jgi:hypothetical protein
MDHVAADVDSKVASDGAGLGLQGFSGTDQFASAGNHALTFPDHGHHRTGRDEGNQAGKERALAVNAVMALGKFTAGGELLEADQLEALALKPPEDVADQAALHAIGLDGNKSAFSSHEKKSDQTHRLRPPCHLASPEHQQDHARELDTAERQDGDVV